MILLHVWRLLRTMARRRMRRRKGEPELRSVDARTLADVGIGQGAIVSLAHKVGCNTLRPPPHL